MPIFSRGESKQKLTILFYMKAAGTLLTREQLYRAMIENGCMEFFDFQVTVNELEEDGYILAAPRQFGQGYTLTDRGGETLALFEATLPHSYRESLKAYAEEHRNEVRSEHQLVSSMTEEADGSYTVRLRAQSDVRPELDICMRLASRDMAVRARNAWARGDCSSRIYRFLLDALLFGADGEEEREEPDAGMPPETEG